MNISRGFSCAKDLLHCAVRSDGRGATPYPAKKILLLCITFLIVFGIKVPTLRADEIATERTIRVSSPEVYADVLEPAGPTGRGVIVVYLQSAGDPVHGYSVELFDVRAQNLLETKISDAAGIIRFAVQAGSYRIYLRRTQHQIATSSVAIAEIRVE